mmetsp:Transcript_12604/g.27875  ORF Transcript_12604/g.27875 Transcript_12604/m.27875 type:complete len:116 (+) Transcript_12604:1157-1504(+)
MHRCRQDQYQTKHRYRVQNQPPRIHNTHRISWKCGYGLKIMLWNFMRSGTLGCSSRLILFITFLLKLFVDPDDRLAKGKTSPKEQGVYVCSNYDNSSISACSKMFRVWTFFFGNH